MFVACRPPKKVKKVQNKRARDENDGGGQLQVDSHVPHQESERDHDFSNLDESTQPRKRYFVALCSLLL